MGNDYFLINREITLWKEWNRYGRGQSGFSKFLAFLDLAFQYMEHDGRFETTARALALEWMWKDTRRVYRFLNDLQEIGFIKYEKRRPMRDIVVLSIEVLENDEYYRFE